MAKLIRVYPFFEPEEWPIEPAPPRRQWMDELPQKLGYKCLPMAIANRYGWIIRCPVSFTCVWGGGDGPADLRITFKERAERFKHEIAAHFPSGVLTFNLPFLFETPEGIGLIIRGATNFFKFNCAPLDGVSETDWSPYNFSMNWKVIKPDIPVEFEKGDPICMVTPVDMNLLEQCEPVLVPKASNPALMEQTKAFHMHRIEKRKNRDPGELKYKEDWDYMHGRYPDGREHPCHRSKLILKPLEDRRRNPPPLETKFTGPPPASCPSMKKGTPET